MTLEGLLRTKLETKNGGTGEPVSVPHSFVVGIQHEDEDGVHFIIHPLGHSGETLDFVVAGDELTQL